MICLHCRKEDNFNVSATEEGNTFCCNNCKMFFRLHILMAWNAGYEEGIKQQEEALKTIKNN